MEIPIGQDPVDGSNDEGLDDLLESAVSIQKIADGLPDSDPVKPVATEMAHREMLRLTKLLEGANPQKSKYYSKRPDHS